MKTYTKEELIKKFSGKFIDTYPDHYFKRENDKWITGYEVRGVSKTIRENYNLPENCIIE